jgi:hypothetical protein
VAAFDPIRFRFIADALNGTGGFAPVIKTAQDGTQPTLTYTGSGLASYLIRYPRESIEKFTRRCDVAWYRNFLLPACQRFAGYLARKPPSRELNNKFFDAVADDCDWRGNSLDVFWQSFTIDAKARGSMLLLVDMPRNVPNDAGTQLEVRAVPYLVAIEPERVSSFSLNERGLLDVVAITDVTVDGDEILRVWSANEWWIQKPGRLDDLSLRIEEGFHGLGVCPVLAFSEMGDFPHVGAFAQIADLSRRYYNAASERDEILRSQTFSLLTYQVPPEQQGFEAGDVAEAIGTHNMLIHQGDVPAFISPADGPATIYGEVLKDLEDTIRRVALTVEQPDQAESGVALTIRFQELNSTLTGFSKRMEDLERRMWDVVCRWLRISMLPEISWAKSYELADIERELTTLDAMKLSAMPEEVIKEQMKIVVGLQFSNLDSAQLNELLDAVDGHVEQVTETPVSRTVDTADNANDDPNQ